MVLKLNVQLKMADDLTVIVEREREWATLDYKTSPSFKNNN